MVLRDDARMQLQEFFSQNNREKSFENLFISFIDNA